MLCELQSSVQTSLSHARERAATAQWAFHEHWVRKVLFLIGDIVTIPGPGPERHLFFSGFP